MAKTSLRTAAMSCLAIWAAIWLMFLMMRFSPLDIRLIPGIGPFMLMALVVALMAPLVATGIAGGGIMAVQSIASPEHRGHLLGDVPALLIVAVVLAFLMPRRAAGNQLISPV